MADDADKAAELQQEEIQRGLANIKPADTLTPNGVCHNNLCSDVLNDERKLFCNGECAREYEVYK